MLAALAFLLAWPVPLWLQQARWPSRAPGAALILWQAIGISGGLSLVMAPITWGLQPFGTGVISAWNELWRVFHVAGIDGVLSDGRWHPLSFAALTLGAIVFGHLILVLAHTAYRTFRERKRHRGLVELLAASLHTNDYGLDSGSHSSQTTRVLPVDHPLAYCLPAINQPLTVISQGLVDELSPKQLSAVLTHESAHLTQRHDLLRLAFQAWHKAAPWLPATRVAVKEVTELTEILADDFALINHDSTDLVTALSHTLPNTENLPAKSPESAATPYKFTNSRRIHRLLTPKKSLGTAKVSVIVILAILLVTIPALITLA